MACLRLTLVEPSSGSGDEAQHVLEALDGRLAHTPGLILSFITEMENDRLARVALWQTKEDANRVAMREDILALRSRLRRLTVRTEETLLDVKAGSLFTAGNPIALPAAFPGPRAGNGGAGPRS